MKQESKSSILFRHWLRANPQYTSSFEMKDTRGKDTFRIAEVKQAQIDYALAIKSDKGVLIRTEGVTGLPDYIYLRNEPAYFVIKYPKHIYIIDVDDFLTIKTKSMTEEQAIKIATKKIPL